MVFAWLYNLFDMGSLYFSAFVNSIILFLEDVATWLR